MTPIDRDNFYQKLGDVMDVASGTMTGSTQLADIEAWDSLAILGFLALADRHYNVLLSAKSITGCQTVDDLAALIEGATSR